MHFGEYRLRAFFHGPHLAREKLFPDFYQAVLRAECQKKVDAWYQQELTEINRIDWSARAQLRRNLAGSNFATDRHLPPAYKIAQYNRDIGAKPDRMKQSSIKEIQAQLPAVEDDACRELAKQKLYVLQQAVTTAIDHVSEH